MAEFYGMVQGNRGSTHRLGSKASGITAKCGSWKGGIRVDIDMKDGKPFYTVRQILWEGRGIEKEIASGFVGE